MDSFLLHGRTMHKSKIETRYIMCSSCTCLVFPFVLCPTNWCQSLTLNYPYFLLFNCSLVLRDNRQRMCRRSDLVLLVWWTRLVFRPAKWIQLLQALWCSHRTMDNVLSRSSKNCPKYPHWTVLLVSFSLWHLWDSCFYFAEWRRPALCKERSWFEAWQLTVVKRKDLDFCQYCYIWHV